MTENTNLALVELRANYMALLKERDEALAKMMDLNAKIHAVTNIFQAFEQSPPKIPKL